MENAYCNIAEEDATGYAIFANRFRQYSCCFRYVFFVFLFDFHYAFDGFCAKRMDKNNQHQL